MADRKRSLGFVTQILRDKAQASLRAGDVAAASAALESVLSLGGDAVDSALRTEVAGLLVLAW